MYILKELKARAFLMLARCFGLTAINGPRPRAGHVYPQGKVTIYLRIVNESDIQIDQAIFFAINTCEDHIWNWRALGPL